MRGHQWGRRRTYLCRCSTGASADGALYFADALYFAGARQEPTSPSVVHHGGSRVRSRIRDVSKTVAEQTGSLLPSKWFTVLTPVLLLNAGPILFDNGIDSSAIFVLGI